MLATWTNTYAVALAVLGFLVVLGGAVGYLLRVGGTLREWWRPTPPLISFGHPSEHFPPSWLPILGVGGSEDEWQETLRRRKEARLARLTVEYLIENKDTAPVRDLSTGIRVRGAAREHTFESCFAPIFTPRDAPLAVAKTVPKQMHEGMPEKKRAENFLYWARFTDERGRQWEATYDPVTRKLDCELLHR